VVRRVRAARPIPAASQTGWWEDQVQVETLAALAAWTQRYDSGEWTDPPGERALLYQLGRISGLPHGDSGKREAFDPDRDRIAFARYLIDVGCQPPPATGRR
jgi:hypothetical protein